MATVEERLKKIEEALWGDQGHLVKRPSVPASPQKKASR